MAKDGYASTAVMVLVGHHCMLRTCELFELRTGDVTFTNRSALLVLRETKMGQRLGIHQETTVSDEWLVRCLQRAHAATRPGCCLVGVTPYRFRALRAACRAETGIPRKYTPYSLRRGGATAMFQWCGHFHKVADKGRWNSIPACRLYITTALAELAGDEEESARAAQLKIFAGHLHSL